MIPSLLRFKEKEYVDEDQESTIDNKNDAILELGSGGR